MEEVIVVAVEPIPLAHPPIVKPRERPPVKGAANNPPSNISPLAIPTAPPVVRAIPVLRTISCMLSAIFRNFRTQSLRFSI